MPCRRIGPVLPVVGRAVDGAVGEGPVARVVAAVVPTPDERVVGSMVVSLMCRSRTDEPNKIRKEKINGRKRNVI